MLPLGDRIKLVRRGDGLSGAPINRFAKENL